MTRIPESSRLSLIFFIAMLRFTSSYSLRGNSEYFGYDDFGGLSPSSYYSSHDTPETIFGPSSPATSLEVENTSPVSYAYQDDPTSTSPDPFFIVEEASSYSGWTGPSPVSFSSRYKSKMRRPTYVSVGEDIHSSEASDDSDTFEGTEKEPRLQRIRSPFVKTRGKMRFAQKQQENEEDEIMMTMSRENFGNSGASFGRVIMRNPNRPGSSKVQEDKKSNKNKKQKVEYFYVDGNAIKVPPTFPSFLSKMYRFAEAKPEQGRYDGNSAVSPGDSANFENENAELDNFEQDREKPVEAEDFADSELTGQPMNNDEFGTEQIDQPLRSQDKEAFEDVPLEEQPVRNAQVQNTFRETEEPSQPTITQEPKTTVLRRPMSLSDFNDRSKTLLESLPGKIAFQLKTKLSEADKAKLRSRNIQILRQQFESVVQRYNNGLTALKRLESEDASQQSSSSANLKSNQPQYGAPPSTNKSPFQFQKENKSAISEKPRSKLQLEVRPSVHIEHHELSNSKSHVDTQLLTIIQKLLKENNS